MLSHSQPSLFKCGRRRYLWIVVALAFLVLVSNKPAYAQGATYDAGLGTLPEAQGWPYTSVFPNPAPVVSGGALHAIDTGGGQYWLRGDPSIDFSNFVLEANLLVNSSNYIPNVGTGTREGYYLAALANNGEDYTIGLASTGFNINTIQVPNNPLTPFAIADGNFHKYRLSVQNHVASFFIDGIMVAGNIPPSSGDIGTGPHVEFGGGSAGSRSDTELKTFCYSTTTSTSCSGCAVNWTSNYFHQWDPPRPVPAPLPIPLPSVYPIPPVLGNNTPQYFGFLPPVNPGFVLCSTTNAGCALTTAATALSSFPIAQTMTPELLDIFLRNDGEYRSGRIDSTGPFEYCEFGPAWSAAVELDPFLGYFQQDPGAGQPLFDQDNNTTETVDQYLQNHVCTDQDRVILKLDENGSSQHNHFILVTGQQTNSNGVTDWTVFDPGWNPINTIPAQNLNTLSGHISGFFTNNGPTSLGTFRKFQVSGVRVFRDLTQAMFGGITITANSPVELLVTDPQGRMLGNINGGADVFEIPNGSYGREFPIADDEGTGIAHGDPSGIKTAYIRSPENGAYQVAATGIGLGTYMLTVRAIASDGSIQTTALTGVANVDTQSKYTISYSSTPGSPLTVTPVATFQSTLSDISNSLALGLIDNQGIANALSSKINAASNAAAGGDNKTAGNILGAFLNQLNAQTGKHINGIAPQVLVADANSLLNQL